MTFLGFGNSLTGGGVLGLLVVIAVRQLGLTDDDGRLGVLFAAASVGSLVVAMALPRLVKRFPVGDITRWSLTVAAGGSVMLAFVHSWPLAGGVLLVYFGAFDLAAINGIAYRQRTIEDEYQSRVNVVARMISWGGAPFGAALAGGVATAFGVQAAVLVVSTGVGLSAALAWAGATHSD